MLKFASQNKQLFIAVILAISIAVIFWSQSRVPALNEKAQMGLRTNFSEIGFDVLLPVNAEQNAVVRIMRSAVNWGYTNLYGMSFGLLFAAAMLTILANLRHRQFRSPWLNALSGVAIGAPLGVCVNCATPIAFGLYSAGARLETALASMIASPTLNAIVLTMTFTLLPFELALAKLAGVALLLLLVPFIVRRFSTGVDIQSVNAVAAQNSPRLPPIAAALPPENGLSLATAIANTSKQFAKSLWYLIRYAVPLMLLAGLLGAVAIELVPFERFADADSTFFGVIFAAIIATILPVPIAFDVIVSKTLLEGGVNIGLVTAFLFGLGVYSIYPAFMIARYISKRLSIAIGVAVVAIALVLGLSTEAIFANKTEVEKQAIEAGLAESSTELYKRAIGICNELPEQLKSGCFQQHLEEFDALVTREALCRTRPSSIDSVQCKEMLDIYDVSNEATENANSALCSRLSDPTSQLRCTLNATTRIAVASHDLGICDRLPQNAMVQSCRENFLNANLVFNPEDSVCNGLPEAELATCKINAAVYRHANTLDFGGCDTLPIEGAREHCRYTIASTMIGRHNDASGCEHILSESMAARCRSLTVAWSASREQRFDLCAQLPDPELQSTCWLRVADEKIQTVFAEVLLAAPTTQSAPLALSNTSQRHATTATDVPTLNWRTIPVSSTVNVEFAPYFLQSSNATEFRQVSADEMGIGAYWQFRVSDFFEPFIIGKGIASGDFNGDIWPDLVLATERGIQLYKNVGGKFESVMVDQGAMSTANLFLVAIVDANNDHFPDVFASAYSGRNYLLYNLDGRFAQTELITFDGDQRLTLAAGFGDLNQDGELDIALGNWSSGVEKLFLPEQSTNELWLRDGDSYEMRKLEEIKGETNTVLLADINGDFATDLLIGNDQLIPDFYYLGDGRGGLNPVTKSNNIIPTTAMFTMSLDAADFDNDLDVDLFATDMTFAHSSRADYCDVIQDDSAKQHCEVKIKAYGILQDLSASHCNDLAGVTDRRDCFGAFLTKTAKDLQDQRFCDKLPKAKSALRSLCQYLAAPAAAETSIDLQEYFVQTRRNILLLNAGDRFDERAETFGVSSSFWSWNAKAADLDNDGWQDIYVGNGFHFGDDFYEIQENVMFRNVNGQRFDEVQRDWGLNDPINTPSYTYTDIDLDGDVDIIATGVLAPPRVFINEIATGNSVTIVLTDHSGNSAGIGSHITVRYGGEAELRQRNEITLSSGFLSFDNPVAHFGLAAHDSIDELLLHWPDGTETVVAGPLPVNGIYRIERQ